MRRARAFAAGVVLVAASCGDGASSQPPVVVVGVDGLTWNVLEPLMREGRAPHFAALVERGVGGKLYTDRPTWSPRLWTSIATGVTPREHGIHHFLESSAKGRQLGRDPLPYTSNCRKVPAIWNVAADQGKRVNSVAWWVSWPAEVVPGGRIVASYAAQMQARILWKPVVWEDGIPELTWPRELQDEIQPLLDWGAPDGPLVQEYNERFGTVPQQWEFPWMLDTNFRASYHADRTHQRIFLKLLEDGVADLNLVYFGLPDVAGHYFWRYHRPDQFEYPVPEEHVDRLGDRLEESYEAVDEWLGEIVAQLPEDAIVLVVSDHGMGPGNRDLPENLQSGMHEEGPPGILVMAGPGVERRGMLPRGERRAGSIYDVAPTVLDLLGIPAGAAMVGSPMRHLMTEEWRAAHPQPEPRDWREGFRPATPPRVPAEGMNQAFIEGMEQIGYAGVLNDAEPDGGPEDG